MKSIFSFILLLFTIVTCLYTKPPWENFNNLNQVNRILPDGESLWVATTGGVIRINKNTEERLYLDRANANLPDNTIVSLAKGADGRIWMGGGNFGIAYYSGNSVHRFDEAGMEILNNCSANCMTIDKNGDLWFASIYYLVKFDGVALKYWQTGNIIMSDNSISDIEMDAQGKIWISGSWGLAKVESDTINYNPEIKFHVSALNFDSGGRLWMGTSRKGLVCYDGNKYKYYDTTNSKLKSNIIIDFTIDKDDNLWISSDSGLTKFNLSNSVNYPLSKINIEDDYIIDIVFDDGIIWLGTFRNGLIKFDGDSFSLINLNYCSLCNNYIADLGIDSYGNKYIASDCINKVGTNGRWEVIAPEIPKTFYNAVNCTADGNIWIGKYFSAFSQTDSSIIVYKDGEIKSFDSATARAAKYSVNVIINDNSDNIWFGTEGGLFVYKNNEWVSYNKSNTPLTTNIIRDLKFDGSGNVWGTCANEFGINNGCIFKFDGKEWHVYQNVLGSNKSNFFDALAIDSKNIIWTTIRDSGNIVGIDYGEGLLSFDGAKWTQYNIKNSGLPANTLFDIFIDNQDNIWAGTMAGGMAVFDGNTKWETYDVSNSGISNNTINVIKQDKDGRLWIGHNRGGVSVFNRNVTSVKEPDESNAGQIVLSPNPVIDFICLDSRLSQYKIEIYSALGEKIMESEYREYIDASAIRAGVYFLKAGKYTCKFVKIY